MESASNIIRAIYKKREDVIFFSLFYLYISYIDVHFKIEELAKEFLKHSFSKNYCIKSLHSILILECFSSFAGKFILLSILDLFFL